MRKFLYLIITGALLTFTVKSFTAPIALTQAEESLPTRGVVITEVMATATSNLEWIEIQNIGSEAVSMEGWKFFENGTGHGLTVYQGEVNLRSNETAIIANKADELKASIPTLDVTIFDSTWSSLKVEGEEIGLKNEIGEFVELFTYIENTENSLQRINATANDYSINNWVNAIMSPGKENLTAELILKEDGETEETAATEDIELPATKDTEPEPEKQNEQLQVQAREAELPNAVITIQTGVLTAYDKVTLNLDGTNSSDPNGEKLTYFWDFGDGYTYENKNPPSHSYKEVGTYLITLRVTNESGLFDETTITAKVLEEEVRRTNRASSGPAEGGTSYPEKKQTKSDEADTKESASTESPTSAAENTQTAATTYPTLLLNEVFPNPTGRDDGQEWVEIYNPNDFAVNIKNYILDDYTDSGSSPMKLKEIEILPKSHYLIHDPSINLNNTNEEIQLLDPSGTLLDKIFFSKSVEAQSYARVKNEWLWTTFPTPGFANEIISDELEVSAKTEEKSDYKNGDLSSELYISEILPNPIGEDAPNEWVELYNSGNLDINLGNWILDDNENGSKPYLIPDDIVIKAKSYLVIHRTDSKISLDNRLDSVRLMNFEDEIQDEISYEKAKENLSFAKMQIIYEDKIETQWTWTPIITKGGSNPKLYKLRGEVEEKSEGIVLIQAKSLKLSEDNELTEIALSPGNLVELTYDDNNEIKEYALIRQKTVEAKIEKSKFLTEILKIAVLGAAIATYVSFKRAKRHENM